MSTQENALTAFRESVIDRVDGFVATKGIAAIQRGRDAELRMTKELQMTKIELDCVEPTRIAIMHALETRGMWVEFMATHTRASDLLAEAGLLDQELMRCIVGTFEQDKNGSIVATPMGVGAWITMSGKAEARMSKRAEDIGRGEVQKILTTDPLNSDINPIPLRALTRMARSVTNPISPQELAQRITVYLTKLKLYLDNKIRARATLAALQISELKEKLGKIEQYLMMFRDKRGSPEILAQIKQTFAEFRIALKTVMHHTREHIQPQAEIFFKDHADRRSAETDTNVTKQAIQQLERKAAAAGRIGRFLPGEKQERNRLGMKESVLREYLLRKSQES